ncbi:MAG TPA: tRNA (adenosine(37)-N6)-dimethylallyltransferase MiaA [Miltoncostaeaceae bacterium]|nr:tRNA (adenosine(37)-N6)-dimethylallyltransferase MiaA [Miltoncostaeaceae bacterium]
MRPASRRRWPFPPEVLALAGPTAAGKSALAHAAARALGVEIVVADPFQRYRGLEIAADSPRSAALAEVTHHCVGDLALTDRSTAAGFAERAHAAIDACVAAGRPVVVSGGTGLYLRAALSDLAFPAQAPPEAREWAERLAARDPEAALAALRARDPEAAAGVHVSNPRRLARALEVAAGGGRRGDALWSAEPRRPTLLVAVTRPREELDRRIAERVRRELDEGLVAELEAALDTPGVSREALQVIGAREVAAVRAGTLDRAELPARLAARTRRLARKQLTWLRKTAGAVALDLGDAPAEAALPALIELWEGAGAGPVTSVR